MCFQSNVVHRKFEVPLSEVRKAFPVPWPLQSLPHPPVSVPWTVVWESPEIPPSRNSPSNVDHRKDSPIKTHLCSSERGKPLQVAWFIKGKAVAVSPLAASWQPRGLIWWMGLDIWKGGETPWWIHQVAAAPYFTLHFIWRTNNLLLITSFIPTPAPMTSQGSERAHACRSCSVKSAFHFYWVFMKQK